MTKKIIVAVSGASGSVFAVDLLKKLRDRSDVEVHGIFSDWAWENLRLETGLTKSDIEELVDVQYDNGSLGERLSSGSYMTDAMIIIPASMKTIAGIASGFSDSLIGRAADVVLKEHRRLILVPRETPLSTIHLENLTKLSRMGVHIIPPIPGFYHHPETIQDLLDHLTARLLDSLGLEHDYDKRWEGLGQ